MFKSSTKVAALIGIVGVTVSALATYVISSGPTGEKISISKFSIPIYPSIADAKREADGILEVQITSAPVVYEDFGEDGKPDFPGEKPLLTEIVKGEIISVLAGDQALKGTEILISQIPSMVGEIEDGVSSSVTNNSRYIILGNLVTANKDVANGAKVWVPFAGGQGVLDITSEGDFQVRSNLIYKADFNPGNSLTRAEFSILIK